MKMPVIGVLALTVAASLAGQVPAPAAFERLKGLTGTWEATGPSGESIRVIYQVISGGTAVLERVVGVAEHGPEGMTSVFYLVGDRLALAHFCSGGNQPRLLSSALAGDTLRFALIPESIANPAEGHIHAVEFRFSSNSRLDTE